MLIVLFGMHMQKLQDYSSHPGFVPAHKAVHVDVGKKVCGTLVINLVCKAFRSWLTIYIN